MFLLFGFSFVITSLGYEPIENMKDNVCRLLGGVPGFGTPCEGRYEESPIHGTTPPTEEEREKAMCFDRLTMMLRNTVKCSEEYCTEKADDGFTQTEIKEIFNNLKLY